MSMQAQEMGPSRNGRVRSGLRSALTIVLVLAFAGGAFAQQSYWYHGRVLWISGNTMGFAPDGGSSFDVDLKGVDQSSYAYLKTGDGVTVIGIVSPNGQKLIGQQVIPDPPYQSRYMAGRRAWATTVIRMLPCG